MPGYREEAERVAGLRNTLHVRQPGYQVTAADRAHTTYQLNVAGALGEIRFEERYGYAVDENARPQGDGGIDFWTVCGSVDVKTALRYSAPMHLMHLAGKPWAHLYVLAYAAPDMDDATLVGWCFGCTLREGPATGVSGQVFRGVDHCLPADQLCAMPLLDKLYAYWEMVRATHPDLYRRVWAHWYPERAALLPPHTSKGAS